MAHCIPCDLAFGSAQMLVEHVTLEHKNDGDTIAWSATLSPLADLSPELTALVEGVNT